METPETPETPSAGTLLTTLEGHTDAVTALSWSPDGRHLVTTGDDGTLRVWEAASGRLLSTLAGHQGAVNAVAWSPDGRLIASGGDDETARIWDSYSGRQIGVIATRIAVLTLAWSPDSQRIAANTLSAGDDLVGFWSVATGAPAGALALPEVKLVMSLAWSPDGRRLVTADSDKAVRMWDVAYRQHLFICGAKLFNQNSHAGAVRSVSWAPDGSRLVSGGDKTVRVWDGKNGQAVTTFTASDYLILAVAWAPDGRRIASSEIGASPARLWDAASGQSLGALTDAPSTGAIAWAPDSTRLATGGSDGVARIWSV